MLSKKDLVNYRKIVHQDRQHLNCLRFGNGETDEHIKKKFELCLELRRKHLDFITEAHFENDLRCDVFVPAENLALKIVVSETEESLKKKAENYPCNLVPIRLNEKFFLEE